jgi:N-acetylglucosaminyl-diphospho-decaprenol L-rhamnosyltransferase
VTSTIERLAVVIVTHNSRDHIGRCLDAIAHSPVQPALVVVVDTASTDGTAAEIARAHPDTVVIVRPANDGFTGGANLGMATGFERGCDAVLLLNPDAFVEPDAIGHLAAAANTHVDALVGARLVLDRDPSRPCVTGPCVSWWRGRTIGQHRRRETSASPVVPVEALSGACLLLRRELVDTIGAFDESYFLYFEDLDLCVRARQAGWQLVVADKAVVRHVEGAATGGAGAPFAMYYFVRNRHRFVRKFQHGRPVSAGFLVYELADVAARVFVALVTGRGALASAVVRGYRDAWR